MEIMTERMVSLKFPDNQTARDAKNKLRANGLHAYLSPDENFEKYPGIEAWNEAHTIVNVYDHFPETGDLDETVDLIERVLND